MINEKDLDMDDWDNERFGSDITDDYKKGFNDSLFLIRSQIQNAFVSGEEQ